MITIITRRIQADLHKLVRADDPSPSGLARVAPNLLALLTGRHTLEAAPTAWAKVRDAIRALPAPHSEAATILLGIGQPPRANLTERRTIAAHLYRVGPDQFAREYERRVLDALTLAIAERSDPNATLPARFLAMRLPPPLSAFRAAARDPQIRAALRTMSNRPTIPTPRLTTALPQPAKPGPTA